MATIDIKLKTYEQLQFEIMKLNTDIALKDKEIERLNNIIDELEKYLCKLEKSNEDKPEIWRVVSAILEELVMLERR